MDLMSFTSWIFTAHDRDYCGVLVNSNLQVPLRKKFIKIALKEIRLRILAWSVFQPGCPYLRLFSSTAGSCSDFLTKFFFSIPLEKKMQ